VKAPRVIALIAILGCAVTWTSCSGTDTTVWDPIGVGGDSGLGPCDAKEVAELPNGHGLVAAIRRTICSGAKDVIAEDYIFVRRIGQKNTAQNLVFRYSETSRSGDKVADIHWAAQSVLGISTGPYWISQVTKKRTVAEGVAIVYSLGKTACPDWDPSDGTWGLCYK
jgi:hypothetical protein